MNPSPAKTPSPQELAKLEHAFASDPSSDAYRPLAEAYLGMGRFMEAMVVCKKGVKAHPTRPDPRVLLARVYSDQGKDKKAIEELQAALQVAPEDRTILRQLGALQMKTGDAAAGRANLLKAWEAAPTDPETLGLLAQWKVELPRPAPPPEPVAPPPPSAAPPGDRAPARSGRTGEVPLARTPVNGAPAATVSRTTLRAAEDEDERLRRHAKASSGAARAFFVALAVAAATVAGLYVWGQWNARRANIYSRNLKEASEQLKHDSFASYKLACTAAEQALEVEPKAVPPHAYLAYAYAIRWGEHGDGDDAKRFADEHLQAAKAGGEVDSHLYAAEALLQQYSGQGTRALGELSRQVKTFDEEGHASSLLYLTLGLVQMNAGDLERARESLEKAQALAPSDPRIYAALGALHRRRGDTRGAEQNFGFALRYEKDHSASLLGLSLLLLEQDNPARYPAAAANLKKLLEGEPPPSPRQLAVAHMARALLIARVQAALPLLKPDEQKNLAERTNVPLDRTDAVALEAKEEQEAFTLDRNNPELRLLKGKRLVADGQLDAGIHEMREAVKMDPTRAQFYVDLARALMLKPEGAREAQDALVTAIRTLPDSPKLMVLLGQAYRRQGRLDDAIAQYNKALADPKARNPDARLQLGIAYREKGDQKESEKQLVRATEEYLGQSRRIAETFTELGRTYEAMGDRAKADEAYQRALNTDADYAEAYFFYARLLAQDKKAKDKARASALAYLRLDPRGEHASEAQRIAQ
jgi:cellulose synthase operon protein C